MITLHNSNLLQIGYKHLVAYPTSSTINYFWSFGSLAGIILVVQILTGIFLAMHYTPHADLAFDSVEHIMRDVNGGWLLRYLHANGASFFFIVVYTHIARNLYWFSFSTRRAVWYSGVTIFLLLIIIAFLGYVLPWGQMSFWAATVITNLFTAVPLVGKSVAQWLWGGFAIGNPTLNRFFSLHYLLPFLVVGLVIAHLSSLHQIGSTNPAAVGNEALSSTNKNTDYITFFPYFYFKDLFMLFLFIGVYLFFVFFLPNQLGHPDNYILANSLVTPAHLVPEWYFLPFYAILRSVPSKLGGFVCMIGSILLLFLIPLLRKNVSRGVDGVTGNLAYFELSSELSTYPTGLGYSFLTRITPHLYYIFIFNAILLTILGGRPVEYPFVVISQYATIAYFVSLLMFSYYGRQRSTAPSEHITVLRSQHLRRGGSSMGSLLYDTAARSLGLVDAVLSFMIEAYVFFCATMSYVLLPFYVILFVIAFISHTLCKQFKASWRDAPSAAEYYWALFKSPRLDRREAFFIRILKPVLKHGLVFWSAWLLTGHQFPPHWAWVWAVPLNCFKMLFSPFVGTHQPSALLFLLLYMIIARLLRCGANSAFILGCDAFRSIFPALHGRLFNTLTVPQIMLDACKGRVGGLLRSVAYLNLCLAFLALEPDFFRQTITLTVIIPSIEVHVQLIFGFCAKSQVMGAAVGIPFITIACALTGVALPENLWARVVAHKHGFILLCVLVETFHFLSLTLKVVVL